MLSEPRAGYNHLHSIFKHRALRYWLREFSPSCTVARFHCEQVKLNHESIIEGEEIMTDLLQRSEERTHFVFAIEQKKTNKVLENSLASVSCL